jgi:hypothetical protein
MSLSLRVRINLDSLDRQTDKQKTQITLAITSIRL